MNKSYFSENLRKQRMEKGFTQEKLADYLGVSAQAVSRWENGSSYPDVSLLPGLAILLEVSVDSLLGMEKIRKAENLDAIFSSVHHMEADGRCEDAIQALREALKLYPGNYALYSELALALAQKEDPSSDSLNEAISLSEKVLSESTNEKLRSTTAANLCYLYREAGEREKAAQLVRTLPHIWESREMLLPDLYDGTESRKKLKEALLSALCVIDDKIKRSADPHSFSANPMIALGAPENSVKEAKDKIARLLQFLDIDG